MTQQDLSDFVASVIIKVMPGLYYRRKEADGSETTVMIVPKDQLPEIPRIEP